jgi:phosphatidylglycerophosphate synthase
VDTRSTVVRVPQEMSAAKAGIWSATTRVPPVLLAWTLGRLAFVPIIIVSLGVSPLLTAVTLVTFVAADLYDGVLARQLGADDPSRRLLDTSTDRLSIWSVYVAAVLAGYLPAFLLALLIVRDVYCGVLCYRMISTRNVAIRADWLYRALNLMLAAWVVAAPLLHAQSRIGAFVVVLSFSVLVAADLRRSVGKVLRMPLDTRNTVISARELRAS